MFPGVASRVVINARSLRDMNLVIVGGQYDEAQAKRLRECLGVRFERKNWVDGARNRILARLESAIMRAEIVILFVKSTGHGQADLTRKLCKAGNVPCVLTMSLNPGTILQLLRPVAQATLL